ncbi:MAG: alginate lyase family protein [Phenylobacterium sp.]|uniref:heparinase II/III family protein n=1 Tax=Phenylobacterium sp. TaxID=1871053 RepID=UPI003BB5DD72
MTPDLPPVFAQVQRLFHTVRYLRPVQVYGRAAVLLRRVKPDLRPAPPVREASRRWAAPVWRQSTMLGPASFKFLNEAHALASDADWNNEAWPRLWLYNLHYFDDLDAFGSESRKDWHNALIARWLAENPPPAGPGWEPYCLSLRIVNWCRWAWSGGHLDAAATHSLAVQLRALADQLEVHLLGNHLWANAKALVVGSLFFMGPEADSWLATGLRYLRRELNEQVLADGGHFERSPMYHNIIAGDLLDLLEAALVVPERLPDGLVNEMRRAARNMVCWAEAMSHYDGEPSFFNDSAMGIAPPARALRAHLEALGLSSPGDREDLLHLRASGYVRAEIGDALLLADVGDIGPNYLPGHAHADTLSFELSLHGRRVLVNSGTSVYEASERRRRERGTAAHNTVVVNTADSSEVWSSFRVARRACTFGTWAKRDAGQLVVEGAHDGYRRLPGRVDHRRRWTLAVQELVIHDELSGRSETASAYFHFHPDVGLREIRRGVFLGDVGGRAFEIAFDGGKAAIEESEWAPEFGLRRANLCLRVDLDDRQLTSRLKW